MAFVTGCGLFFFGFTMVEYPHDLDDVNVGLGGPRGCLTQIKISR
jgi:hypothetical protein